MAVEKLSMVTLSGPVDMIDTALRSCIINRDFHLENAIDAMEGVKRLSSFDMKNPYYGMLQMAYSLLEETGLEPHYVDFSGMDFTPESAENYLKKLIEQTTSMYDLREEKRELITQKSITIAQLKNLEGIDVDLDEILAMKYVKFRFGRIRPDDAADFRALAMARDDVFYFAASRDSEWEYGLYVELPNRSDQLDSVFASLGWERIWVADSMSISGTPDRASAELERQVSEAKQEIEELTHALAAIKDIEGQELLACYSYARFLSDSFELRSYSGHRNGKFYIVGWVGADEAEQYAAECEKIKGLSCIISTVHETKQRIPPSKMKAGPFTAVFRPFVEMYGSPAYGAADPAVFLSITYTVIFGAMFGDVGQGIVLSLAGFLIWKMKKLWLGRILAVVGVSAAAFGFVYGSVFGNEHLLPGFKVLEGGNTMSILIIAVIAGMFMLLVCMILNIAAGVKNRDVKRIFFSSNGLAGMIVYSAAAFGVANLILFGRNIMTTPYIVGLIIAPLLLIMSSEPLTRLMTNKRPLLPHSIGMFFVEGFFEVFETVLSYISNTVSFLRIGAFAISHAGMMMVVYMLSGGGSNIFGLIIGNAIVMGIEATLVCIQVMRLEFYEMFGRFVSGGGRKFSPRVIDYEKTSAR